MKALVVDDEKSLVDIFRIVLEEFEFEVNFAFSFKEAEEKISKNYYDFAILDLKLPDGSGLDLLRLLKNKNEKTEVVIITAYSSSETAVEAIKTGSYDYISKPFDISHLRRIIKNIKQKLDIEKSLTNEEDSLGDLTGKSPAILKIKGIIKKVAPYDINVLIVGESGTGKEVAAKYIHKLSNRKDKPFVAINCASLPSELLESELFGYVKGAFTGAESNKKGLIEVANGGTLFLDEIGEMPLSLQSKLLRFLEDKKIRPIGSTKEIPVDVRIISATNKDLKNEIEEGKFRNDLYFRLAGITIKMPPLRERREDIPLIINILLKELMKKYNKKITKINPDFIQNLTYREYDGNIRELKNILEKAVILSENGEIDLKLLDENKFNSVFIDNPEFPINIRTFPEEGLDIKRFLENVEKAILIKALEITNGNKTKTAELLGLTFREFRYRYSKYFPKTDKNLTAN
jgi:two-component system response regulator PilR (NtrC family)